MAFLFETVSHLDSAWLYLPVLGLQVCTTIPDFLHGCWGSALQTEASPRPYLEEISIFISCFIICRFSSVFLVPSFTPSSLSVGSSFWLLYSLFLSRDYSKACIMYVKPICFVILYVILKFIYLFESGSHCIAAVTGKLLYRVCWPWTYRNSAASASQVLGCATTPDSHTEFFFKFWVLKSVDFLFQIS